MFTFSSFLVPHVTFPSFGNAWHVNLLLGSSSFWRVTWTPAVGGQKHVHRDKTTFFRVGNKLPRTFKPFFEKDAKGQQQKLSYQVTDFGCEDVFESFVFYFLFIWEWMIFFHWEVFLDVFTWFVIKRLWFWTEWWTCFYSCTFDQWI